MLAYAKLNISFDAELLQRETMQLENSSWLPHYNKSDYVGQWTVLPLRSINGSLDNVVSIHQASGTTLTYADTPLLQSCDYLRSVLSFFQCEKLAVRLMKLHAGAEIKTHRDLELSLEEGEARLHIPVITNSSVAFYLNEEQISMQQGECWYLNLSLPHRVQNKSSVDRVHLVIDCVANDWLRNLITADGNMQKQIETTKNVGPESGDKQKIIDELRRMNTLTSLALADKLETEA